MNKICRMGRKKLGKEKYHFTCQPELMSRFDEIAALQGITRSDLLVAMIRERIAKNDQIDRKRDLGTKTSI